MSAGRAGDPGTWWPRRVWALARADPTVAAVAVLAAGAVLGLADAAIACRRELTAGATAGATATERWLAALALGLAGGTLVALPLALGAAVALFALRRASPRTQALAATATLALGLSVAASAVHLDRIEWRAVDPWLPASLLVALIGFAAGLALSLHVGRSARRITCGALPVVAAAALAAFSATTPDARAWALAAVDGGGVWLAPPLQRVSRALDADGDLHPRWLCGRACDCDDTRADVHPMAAELPDNGIDEDCDGRDATRAEVAHPGHGTEPRAAVDDAPPSGGSAPPPMRPPDVLLIVIDTLRPDHLGLHGYPRPTSPRIDALAEGAVVFEQARSAGPSTRFSIPAMLTSKWFTELERNDYEWPAISKREVLLGERLSELGYTLAAFHSIRYFRPYFGLGQGFDHWSDAALDVRKPELKMISSDYITDEALEWIDGWLAAQSKDAGIEAAAASRPPLFLWAYYGDPHAAYMRHPEPFRFGHGPIDRYDGEIAFTDHHVGRLLDGMKTRGFGDDLIVVLTSDHGEALDRELDHGSLNHSKSLYDELIRVPLIVKGPGFAPGRVQTPVSLIDLLPTFLALAGAPLPGELRGVSLLPWLERAADATGPEPAHPPLFFEKHRAVDDPQQGMLAWPYKLISTPRTGRVQIFDVQRDPHERHDLGNTLAADERQRLERTFRHWASRVLKPSPRNYRH